MPAVLIETAFIDNSRDATILKNRQDDFANAIFTAVIGTAGENPRPNPGPNTPEIEQIMKDIVATAKRYRKTTGNGNNTEMINIDILDYLRAYKYADWKWDIILGGVSTFFEYMVNENPELHAKFFPYIRSNDTKIFSYKGHDIDLPHLAAVTLGYYEGKVFPYFWNGWGGDLASAMEGVQKYKANTPNHGTDDQVADKVIGNELYKFPVADIESDIDAIHFSNKLSIDNIYILFEIYYTNGYNSRKSLITWDIDRFYSASKPQDGTNSLSNKIYQIMIGNKGFKYVDGFAGFALSLLAKYDGNMASDSEIKATCNAFAKYISNKL